MRFNSLPYLRRSRVAAIIATAVFCVIATHISAESVVFREYDIKAAYLYNFIKYVDWPPQGLPDPTGTITIGLLGENPFGPVIHTLDGKMAKGRKVAVKENVGPAE